MKIKNNNKRKVDSNHITTEASSKGILNNCTKPNVSCAIMNTLVCENSFDAIVNSIKVENYSHLLDESNDVEDSASVAHKFINNKNKKQQQQEMCELASSNYEKDVHFSVSNSQELTDTKLVDGKIISMRASSPSTALPIMKILSPKLGPHTCLECCFKCNNIFRVLDSPLHICQIRSIDKQNEFLKIEPSLCVDSCLCNFCWKYLERTYKSNKSKNKKEESYSEKKSRLLERYVKKNVTKNKSQARKCSIHLCSQPYSHKMPVKECENIKKIFLTFEYCRLVFVQSTKQTTDFLKFPFCVCKIHNAMILVMSTCQICGDKLNAPFNTDDWSMYEMWNFVLIENNLPLMLKPGMFICVTCKEHISKTNPGFPPIDLPRLREYILISNAIRLKLYGESQDNLFNICQGSTYVASPIVVPKIQEEKECVRSTKVKFSDPLITTNYNFDIDNYKNDTESITSTVLLNVAEQNLCTHKLEPKDEELDFVKLKEKYFKTFTSSKPKDHLYNFYSDPTPNTSGIGMTNSLNESVDDTYENILSEQNPPANLTDNNVSNNLFNLSYVATNVEGHDDNKEFLQLHVDHQLKNYNNKISKNEGIKQYLGTANDNSLQNLCEVDNLEIDENESEIIGSHQVVNGHNEIENNQSQQNSHALYSVIQDKSSMNLKEVVEPPNAIVNSVLIKRKQSYVVCDSISNKDVKNQKLNEKYNFYENNSSDDNTTKSYRSKNIAHPNVSVAEDEDIELNTNGPSNLIEKAYSFDSGCVYNIANMFLYLMENLRKLDNVELVVSDEFYEDYILKERKTILFNFFGDTEDSMNASNPFIHPSSHLRQYSKQLSFDNIGPFIIKDIKTTTNSSTQSNSIFLLKKNVSANKRVRRKFNNKTTKLLPIRYFATKSRNNIKPTNSVPKVPNHLLTYTKPLLTSGIPYLPDGNQTLTCFITHHPTTSNIQFPIAIKKKRYLK